MSALEQRAIHKNTNKLFAFFLHEMETEIQTRWKRYPYLERLVYPEK